MQAQNLAATDLRIIITAIIVGTLARIITLKEDFRQYPTYPNGYFINIIVGFVAASLGAVALPALMSKNFVAVTFLTLAIQQFRDVRKMEKNSLNDLEQTEFTYRGAAYIDGIAKTFEARNYLALVIALATSVFSKISSHIFNINEWFNIILGVMCGSILMYFLIRFSKGKTIGDIAQVTKGKVEIRDNELFVDGLYVSNLIGSDNAQNLIREEAIAAVIHPNEVRYRINIDNFGQRQAALFEATRTLGVKRYNFTRKDYSKGRVIIVLVPIIRDSDALIEAIKKCPILETTKKTKALMETNLKD